jgi:hypothetical protein
VIAYSIFTFFNIFSATTIYILAIKD